MLRMRAVQPVRACNSLGASRLGSLDVAVFRRMLLGMESSTDSGFAKAGQVQQEFILVIASWKSDRTGMSCRAMAPLPMSEKWASPTASFWKPCFLNHSMNAVAVASIG